MNWIIKKFLLRAMLGILTLYAAISIYQQVVKPEQPITIIKPNQQVADSKYIISEDAILSKLRSKSQIVSMQQDINKKDTYVDETWAGERHTQLKVHGTYKMGLNTNDIEIKHIDNQNGIVFLHIDKPVLISMDIPYDQVEFDKTKGWLRLSMDESEQKKFYKAAEKNIVTELMKDKEVMKQADLRNKDVIMDLLKMLPEIKSVVFQ